MIILWYFIGASETYYLVTFRLLWWEMKVPKMFSLYWKFLFVLLRLQYQICISKHFRSIDSCQRRIRMSRQNFCRTFRRRKWRNFDVSVVWFVGEKKNGKLILSKYFVIRLSKKSTLVARYTVQRKNCT